MTFTDPELSYLASQRLGRLATLGTDGRVQNNPVGFYINADGTIDIRGHRLSASRKFRNVRDTGTVALVVDDLASVDPWRVRGIEIRGTAEALENLRPSNGHRSTEVIRIHPRRIIVWGIEPGASGRLGRDVT